MSSEPKYATVGNQSPLPLIDLYARHARSCQSWESVTSPFDRLNLTRIYDQPDVGNQSPLPLIDLKIGSEGSGRGWESVTSPFDRLIGVYRCF